MVRGGQVDDLADVVVLVQVVALLEGPLEIVLPALSKLPGNGVHILEIDHFVGLAVEAILQRISGFVAWQLAKRRNMFEEPFLGHVVAVAELLVLPVVLRFREDGLVAKARPVLFVDKFRVAHR